MGRDILPELRDELSGIKEKLRKAIEEDYSIGTEDKLVESKLKSIHDELRDIKKIMSGKPPGKDLKPFSLDKTLESDETKLRLDLTDINTLGETSWYTRIYCDTACTVNLFYEGDKISYPGGFDSGTTYEIYFPVDEIILDFDSGGAYVELLASEVHYEK